MRKFKNVVLDANVNGDGMLKGGLNNRYDEDEDKNEGAYNYGIRDVGHWKITRP